MHLKFYNEGSTGTDMWKRTSISSQSNPFYVVILSFISGQTEIEQRRESLSCNEDTESVGVDWKLSYLINKGARWV